MNVRILASFAAFTISAAVAVPAWADVAPPNTAQCASLAEGDACTTDAKTDGACVKSTCTGLDYSNGTPPTTKTYDCLVCTEGAPGSGGGCSFAAGHAGTAGVALAVLGAALLWSRRRRAA